LSQSKTIAFSSALLIFLSLNSTAIAADQIQWQEWSDTPFEQAKQQNKLVLVDIKAVWCKFCKKMEKVTYQDPQVISAINENYIAIRGDIEKTLPIKQRYGYFGVPATIILNGDGKEINRRLGYIKPQFMQWHLLGVLSDYQEQQNTKKSISKEVVLK